MIYMIIVPTKCKEGNVFTIDNTDTFINLNCITTDFLIPLGTQLSQISMIIYQYFLLLSLILYTI